MPRVVGIDPGTVSIDVCGIDDGRLFLDRSFPTGRALAEPAAFVALLDAAGPLDLVAGDRKSTRLNSSHPSTSYAVFCLKKKKRKSGGKFFARDHAVPSTLCATSIAPFAVT